MHSPAPHMQNEHPCWERTQQPYYETKRCCTPFCGAALLFLMGVKSPSGKNNAHCFIAHIRAPFKAGIQQDNRAESPALPPSFILLPLVNTVLFTTRSSWISSMIQDYEPTDIRTNRMQVKKPQQTRAHVLSLLLKNSVFHLCFIQMFFGYFWQKNESIVLGC